MQTLGVDLVALTPSRGYSAELAASVIIVLASTYGLPVSTTQIIVSSITTFACTELCQEAWVSAALWCPMELVTLPHSAELILKMTKVDSL